MYALLFLFQRLVHSTHTDWPVLSSPVPIFYTRLSCHQHISIVVLILTVCTQQLVCCLPKTLSFTFSHNLTSKIVPVANTINHILRQMSSAHLFVVDPSDSVLALIVSILVCLNII